MIIYVGLDDTDHIGADRGTGKVARWFEDSLPEGCRMVGVLRQQLLIHDGIPYTSHNSGACIALESDKGLNIRDFVFEFIAHKSAEGSDPGVCIADIRKVPKTIVEFANRTTERVVTMSEAFDLAKNAAISLHGLGGTCQGIIGALGSVGLRASGENGRVIDLPGLRELSGCVGAEAFDRIGITVEHRGNERSPGADDRYKTLDWVRPRLTGGKAVLPVQWSEKEDAWIPVDKQRHATN